MEMKHWEVTLEGYGTARVEAVDKLRAICAAAKGWGLRWTDMARACTVVEIPTESPTETASLGFSGEPHKEMRPAAAHSPNGRGSHVCGPRGVFPDAHVAGENGTQSFAPAGAKEESPNQNTAPEAEGQKPAGRRKAKGAGR